MRIGGCYLASVVTCIDSIVNFIVGGRFLAGKFVIGWKFAAWRGLWCLKRGVSFIGWRILALK